MFDPITLSQISTLGFVGMAGMMLGTFFFMGLWWTIRHALHAENPALWFAGSFIIRTAVALGGFYHLADGQWQRLVAALVGFVLIRVLLLREVNHAP